MTLLERAPRNAGAAPRLRVSLSVLTQRVRIARKTPEQHAAAEARRVAARAAIDRLLR